MEGKGRFTSPIDAFLPVEVEGFEALARLALNMRWSWNHKADALWRRLDLDLWRLSGNPWVVLQTVSAGQLKLAMADPGFRAELDALLALQREADEKPAWFQNDHPKSPLKLAAYFSMEFMLSEALPIYSGGLGNVAGDQLKAASDLGVPIVGVGLLYQQGYFRQTIGKDGGQEALFPYNDPGQLPITPLRGRDGEWLRVQVDLPGYPVWARAWQADVGRVKLYLLDTNDAANYPANRGITSELYGGGPETRLKQEMVLGIGGWRLLKALGLSPEVCHLNEGHAAFTVLERARDFMKESGRDFAAALAVTRAGNLFTTHTPIPAGFDRFSPDLVEQYLGSYARDGLGIQVEDLLALGRMNPGDKTEPFNMAYLALRGSGAVNGVSRLHGAVSREIFQPLFPSWPRAGVPVSHVTNGVHMPSWDSAAADALWTGACGQDRWLGEMTGQLEEGLRRVPLEELWRMRNASRTLLVEFARRRLARQFTAAGVPAAAIERAKHIFNPDALTIGFARRFAAYKRPNLLLHDRERLLRILSDAKRPVQLIIAGKAHPADGEGQALIKEWINFIRRPEAREHILFLSDYDMLLTERLVRGVDVWINTPRRPWEACGTSGMKVLVNGGLNLSELDGWWVEGYTPEAGWALGDGKEHMDPAWDGKEAEQLYEILEREVVPEFYTRDEKGLPAAWVERVRESAARLTPRFSATRTVREYTELHYLPAAENYGARAAENGRGGAELVAWRALLEKEWGSLKFGRMKVETAGDQHNFEIQVFLGKLPPEAVLIELYAEPVMEGSPFRGEMNVKKSADGAPGEYICTAGVPAELSPGDYTARMIPRLKGAAVPLEDAHILWQG